ncbi:ATP-binding cassette domain-containing protein [Brachybacterium paraconglomeratum]|uniref:ATP-binding cassette domain-containing protein n=1 Tax=Brachybacterium paraconglomeratum TaxID=173362 RepID=UPI0022E90B7E|nr:ATP-binding cassette domain-containing protein [Brachybacterium paraconglomeratum]
MSQRTTSHLRARELQLSRGGRVLLTGIDLTLVPGAVLAVVGENGRGKTTLLEALAGTLEPDAGTVERHGALGVVRQELATADGTRTVGDLLDALLDRPLAALREHDAAADALADGTAEAARRYDDALARVTALDAWDAPRRLEVALEEVGAVTDRDRELTALSVGQRYRVRLAGVIAARDEILLLDEPTNHLDARGLAHLTRALREHPGAVALVSHDRALLEDVATSVLDLDPTEDGRPLLVGGGLAEWEQARRRARTAWEDAYRAQQEEQRRLQEGADAARSRLSTGWRPDKGTGKHQRQSRAPGTVRALNDRLARLEEHRLDVPPPPPRLSLPDSGTSAGTPLLRADGVRVDRADGRRAAPGSACGCSAGADSAGADRTPDPSVPPRLPETTLRLEGGDRLLVVGPNGAGKTTLLRVLAGDLAPDAGAVRVLGRARLALLAQEDERQEPRRGSPGERRRQALSRLFSERPDVLLLDEPTNHLGISGVDDLLEALERTSSAVVVASHDRTVLRRLAHWPRLDLGEAVRCAAGRAGVDTL